MWQPIETAPRVPYRKLLLRIPGPFFDTTEDGVAVGQWTGDSWHLSCVWASSDARREPTHWMPIPEFNNQET